MDIVDKQTRSKMMSNIKGKNTKPELIIRSSLHRMGFRFRLKNKKLPGNPDLVLPKYKVVIFVHGCFWHQHEYCKISHIPKTRTKFWTDKFNANIKRDNQVYFELKNQGSRTAVIWECCTRDKKVFLNISKNYHHGLSQIVNILKFLKTSIFKKLPAEA